MSQESGYSLTDERSLKPVQTGSNEAIFKRHYNADKRVSIPMEWFGFDMQGAGDDNDENDENDE